MYCDGLNENQLWVIMGGRNYQNKSTSLSTVSLGTTFFLYLSKTLLLGNHCSVNIISCAGVDAHVTTRLSTNNQMFHLLQHGPNLLSLIESWLLNRYGKIAHDPERVKLNLSVGFYSFSFELSLVESPSMISFIAVFTYSLNSMPSHSS